MKKQLNSMALTYQSGNADSLPPLLHAPARSLTDSLPGAGRGIGRVPPQTLGWPILKGPRGIG